MTKTSAQATKPSESTNVPSVPQEIRDTTESIVMAFILAFVFRAFIIEAFVIPTGSMAATLYGQHGTLICEDCGWENAYGLTDASSPNRRHGPHSQVRCQNCNHVNSNLKIHDGVGGAGGRPLVRPNSEAGDRILVFKWPLDLLSETLGPDRWDVTVFKNPANGDENFIKRLLGLPNEVLEIIDGDIYTVPVEALSAETVGVLDGLRRVKFQWQNKGFPAFGEEIRLISQPLPDAALSELARKLQLQPKTPGAQETLWMAVYHHDYPPRVWSPEQPRWLPLPSPGVSWQAAGRLLSFRGAHQRGQATIAFDGKPIVDHNAYNIDVPRQAWHPVSDLRLEMFVESLGGEGDLQIVLTKNESNFIARWSAEGNVTLLRRTKGNDPAEQLASAQVSPLRPGRLRALAFQCVDYRVSMEIDGEEVWGTTPEQYSPDIESLRVATPKPATPPAIAADGIDVDLHHVVLYRDVYYTSPYLDSSVTSSARQRGWGTVNQPILLRKGEYFMLGDNSPASKDSRLWDFVGPHLAQRGEDVQLGTVPRDQIVGRAFFVYWPSGLRPDWLPGRGEHFVERFVPNVGRMRWIR